MNQSGKGQKYGKFFKKVVKCNKLIKRECFKLPFCKTPNVRSLLKRSVLSSVLQDAEFKKLIKKKCFKFIFMEANEFNKLTCYKLIKFLFVTLKEAYKAELKGVF